MVRDGPMRTSESQRFATQTLAVTVALALLSTGCAAIRAAGARDSYIQSQVVDQPIGRPVEQVWPALKTVLAARGTMIAESDDSYFTLKTTVAPDSSTQGQVHWFTANAQRLDATSCKMKIVYVTEATATDGRKARIDQHDWQLELEVLKLVDPQRAAAIEGEAQSRYDGSYNAK